jgi:hypothetical protein
MSLNSYAIIDGMLLITLEYCDPYGFDPPVPEVRKAAMLPFPGPAREAYFACYDRGLELVAQGWSQAEILWALDIYNRVACHGELPMASICFIALSCSEPDIPGMSELLALLCHGILVDHVSLGQPLCDWSCRCLDGLALNGKVSNVNTTA